MSLTIRISLAAALAVAGATASSSAAEKMSAPRCVAMDAKMMGHAMPELPAATGNIDRDFAAAMKSQMQAMVALEKSEVDCGNARRRKPLLERCWKKIGSISKRWMPSCKRAASGPSKSKVLGPEP
ncbi:MAG: hypothetical protein NVS3B17_01520 [Vulcanimicrobiaceae bacterium]